MKELFLNIYSLAYELIANPREFWRNHATGNISIEELLKNLLLPLMAVVAVAVFIGEFFRSEYFRIWLAALWSLREIVIFAALYFIGVYGTKKLISYFGYEVPVENLQKLVSYSLVPFFVVSAFTGLFPFFYFLDIFGIYGFYIFMMGGRKLLLLPKENRDNLILKIIAANWIAFGLISFATAKLLMTLE